MATLSQAKKNARGLRNLKSNLFSYIKLIENNFLTLEKERIHDKSEDIFGKPLGYYSEATESITGGEKRAGDPFTGVDTGDFFKGFYMRIQGDKLFFGSTDSKTDEILKSKHWLTHELFGQSDEDLRIIIDENILPFLHLTTRKILKI